jgi:hypothetical protein
MLDVTASQPLDRVNCPACGEPNRVRTRLKNYLVDSVLGAGGMGTVYKALDLDLNRHVALKVVGGEFSKSQEHLEKFKQEARITALVNHPNVVKVYSFGEEHGVLFIAMELVDKGNLDDLMVRIGRIAEIQALEVGIQIAEGLKAAHEQGLIHRDVKPGNILFADAHTAKIVDFGLACLAEEEAEAKGEIWGTPYYVAPEKLDNRPEDFRSDIYSLGASLFHAISGRPPHEAETASMVALKHIKSKAVSLQAFAPHVSSATSYVINRMLQQEPGQRQQSYDELIGQLRYAHEKVMGLGDGRRRGHRSVVDEERQQSLLAWMALLPLGAIVFLGLGAYMYRDSLFSRGEQPASKQAGANLLLSEGDATRQYDLGRALALQADYAGAQKLFRELSKSPGLPQPLGRWVVLQQGLTALLAGNPNEAGGSFKILQQRGLFSLDPADRVQANFFVETGRLVSEGKPVPPAVIKSVDPDGCEALGLFIFALHDWQMSDFDDAGPLLRAFLNTNPQPPFAWIAEYKPVAKKYLADFDAYKSASVHIQSADTLEKKSAALEALRALKSPPLMPGRLQEKLLQMGDALEKEIATGKKVREEKEAARLAALRERENAAMADARLKASALTESFQYDEALAAVQKVAVSLPEMEGEREALLKKTQWLSLFKNTLIGDLRAAGYPLPVLKRNGVSIAGRVGFANRSQVESKNPYGTVVVLWTELAPSSILAMADYFIQKSAGPAAIADRCLAAAVFAHQNGMAREGDALFEKAVAIKPEYRDLQSLVAGAPPEKRE